VRVGTQRPVLQKQPGEKRFLLRGRRLSDRIPLPMAPVDHGNPYRTIGDGVVRHLDFLYRFRASGAV
jgi:hypothetical protein